MTSVSPVERRGTGRRARRRHLSVCTLTTGRRPERLAAILRLLRPAADEIIVALDDRRPEALDALATVADRIALFPHAEPGDRPIAWLFGLCRGDWIFNVDDDEVPGPRLVEALPRLIQDPDVTHCWIARRWLHRDLTTFLAEPPWSNEYQLRLFQSDERFLRFTDEFHLPVACYGPMRFVDAPLWHLDTVLTTFDERRRKALEYERARRGMRIASYSHNTGLYLPELRGELALAAVPTTDLDAIRSVYAAGAPGGPARSRVERAARSEIDAVWPGTTPEPSFYDAHLSLLQSGPGRIVAGVQQTIDVGVENRGTATWRSGRITIGTRWDAVAQGIRTGLPADIRGGTIAVVPVHVVAPAPGLRLLEIDLVHEHFSWFGKPLRIELRAMPRRRVLVVGFGHDLENVLDALAFEPELEPVVLVPSHASARRHGHPEIEDPADRLFGSAGTDTARAAARSIALCGRALLRRPGHDDELLAALAGAEALVVAGTGVEEGRPPTRQRLRLVTLELAARAAGVPVVRAHAWPSRPGAARVDRLLDGIALRLRKRSDLDGLFDDAGGGTRTPTPLGRRF